MSGSVRYVVHNCVAHPVLGVGLMVEHLTGWRGISRLADWLHDRTIPHP